MGDRVRIGELLAAIGTIALIVSLTALDWFHANVTAYVSHGPITLPYDLRLALDAGTIGWFAFLVLVIALVASVVFLLRVLTGRGPERASLQAPYAYVAAGFAVLTLLVRLFIFKAGVSTDSVLSDLILRQSHLVRFTADFSLASGAWVAFAAVILMMLGAWFSMYDERTGSKAARQRTELLLADVRPRAVPHVDTQPEPDATVVADDAVGTDPSSSSSPASGGPA